MRVLEWVWNCWGRAAREGERKPPIYAIQRPTAGVPAEWLSLYTYLEQRYASTVVLTFSQMERLLGRALPAAARTEREWWTDKASRAGRCSNAWTAARRAATPNLAAGTVAFERLS
jgi:hypothetical protein